MKILVIGGPTAIGKSDLACCVAQKLNGEIISADSMAVYKFMDIGTAKPLECMKKVPHHLIDVVEPGGYFDAKIFEEMAKEKIEEIKRKGKVPIVVGGTYLYIQALLYGIDETPKPDWNLRNKLYEIARKKGNDYLYEKLKAIDPKYAKKIHKNDLRRIVRALEVFINTGKPFSSFHSWNKPKMDFVGIYLKRSPESLYKRIENRVYDMVKDGLLEEVKKLLEMGYENFLTSGQAIDYKEFVPCAKGEKSLEECIKEAIKNTKKQAKRQIRWFRKQGWHEIDLDKLSIEEACEEVVRIYKDANKTK
ncbi:tRNA (adenosine(37)-N6)-dimethylallyltransferase MiaA [Aquifex aeolicus]|uniref:tRNA dimethylallyltransferase n=1 Tax=Aquifex aeolicus (strain VF5) TaxID=224324 RepID=MIAA_AQUAE|nr:tRNA (adenosine(37)-N6)-dimethylallyltransferase MiaA [Aquifex aeolicus]O67162.1 RecName: Full=tRNA dimethylallyltransferase; AltName: Full=Dimethylallyl diphosphate:tRNA dimethylallyltransferase; Short=DMAPP:tRNA dimethylallyltransferase; Short=DMATase; AltName: Full=Isopentenyl-diphosphate:tRNA isopentenyltransferase; Short=IPP transferase; Short=IPPT; Short=IPTase [Aquifex aeolicus VF5]AAC07124.1 tRNA delta-2-isopentenylpyrophosphate (IPP) transferase [Aquifex aeolicus VF5]